MNAQDRLELARQYAQRKINKGARLADACEAASATYGIDTDKIRKAVNAMAAA